MSVRGQSLCEEEQEYLNHPTVCKQKLVNQISPPYGILKEMEGMREQESKDKIMKKWCGMITEEMV